MEPQRAPKRAFTRSDASLVESMTRYVEGDPRAFATLHRTLEPRLRARIAAIVGARGPVDDLVQLTFLLAHRARHRWVPRASDGDAMVRGWFHAIARNVAITELRRGAARPLPATESVDDEPDSQLDPERSLDEQEHARGQRQALLDGLEQLPPAERDLLRQVLEGASLREVAGILGIRPGAARLRAHRARERLRGLVSKRYPVSAPAPASVCVLGFAHRQPLARAS